MKPGTQAGSESVIRGKGVNSMGDLIIKWDVVIPPKSALSSTQISSLQKLLETEEASNDPFKLNC